MDPRPRTDGRPFLLPADGYVAADRATSSARTSSTAARLKDGGCDQGLNCANAQIGCCQVHVPNPTAYPEASEPLLYPLHHRRVRISLSGWTFFKKLAHYWMRGVTFHQTHGTYEKLQVHCRGHLGRICTALTFASVARAQTPPVAPENIRRRRANAKRAGLSTAASQRHGSHSGAVAQGITVLKINQNSAGVTVVYKYPSGHVSTVLYQVLPAGEPGAVATSTPSGVAIPDPRTGCDFHPGDGRLSDDDSSILL